MSTETKESLKMLRVADAAKLADVSEDTVMKWIAAGHVQVFVPPGHKVGDGHRGPKSVRIFLADWMAFLAAYTGACVPDRASAPIRAARSTSPAPADGVKRRNQWKSRPS